ncbi:MAG: hypothetical protein ACYC6M_01175 [Terriglobales bacterium]
MMHSLPVMAAWLLPVSGYTVYSVLILLSSLGILGYALCAFSHARLQDADVQELERLHREGLLSPNSTLEQDFRTISYLLDTIAPAVYMRQEIWVRLYYYVLRISRLTVSYSASLELELRRLVAHQSHNYRIACGRLAEIRAS